MQELFDKILTESVVLGNEILNVDTFLNHQIDPNFIMRVGQELAGKFKNYGVTKVFTLEDASIAVAMATAMPLGVPVVFAKKETNIVENENVYSAEVYSFTLKKALALEVSSELLRSNDTVLIVDDLLAYGAELKGLVNIVRQAGAALAGVGIVIEKQFQMGGDILRSEGVRIESLAKIERMNPGVIYIG
jgi:xanthine phosphoribosyltransferase